MSKLDILLQETGPIVLNYFQNILKDELGEKFCDFIDPFDSKECENYPSLIDGISYKYIKRLVRKTLEGLTTEDIFNLLRPKVKSFAEKLVKDFKASGAFKIKFYIAPGCAPWPYFTAINQDIGTSLQISYGVRFGYNERQIGVGIYYLFLLKPTGENHG